MKWTSYASLYLLCTAPFWLVHWIQPPSVLGFALFGAAGLILLAFDLRAKNEKRTGRALLWIGCGLVSYAALSFFLVFFSNVHNYESFGPLLAFVFRLFGYAATSQHGMLMVGDEWTSNHITIDAEKLGLMHGSAILVVFIAVSFFLHAKKRRMLLFAAGWIVFLCIRFLVLIVLFLYTRTFSYGLEHLAFFWSPAYIVLSFIPLVVLARFTLRWEPPQSTRPSAGRIAATAALFTASFIFFQLALWLDLPGERKAGRVLLDDYYSDVWEPSTQEFNTTEYGRNSVYNMFMARKYLEHFYTVRVNTQPITEASLANVDVLVIKTPIYRLSDTTQNAIHRFVARGGGLLLIGDHTDLMGMTSHLNELSKRYGILFRYDATYDLTTGHDNHSYDVPLFRVSASPSLSDVRMMTSCTMEISPFTVRPLTHVVSSIADEADYSRPSFFGPMEIDLMDEFGAFVIGAVRDAGDGKVAAICESTIFSNFGVFTSGREEWLRRLVELVNHRAASGEMFLRILSLILFAACFIAGCFSLRKRRNAWNGAAMLFAVPIGIWIGTTTVDVLGWNLEDTKPTTPLPRIYFQQHGTTFNLPDAMAHYHGFDVDAFETIFVNVARLGYMPQEIPTIAPAMPTTAPVVLIKPERRAFSDTLLQWIESGGKAMIFVSDSMNVREMPQAILPREQPLVVTMDSVMVRYVYHGKGRIVYLGPSSAFSRYGIGNNMEPPTPNAQTMLETVYNGLRWLESRE